MKKLLAAGLALAWVLSASAVVIDVDGTPGGFEDGAVGEIESLWTGYDVGTLLNDNEHVWEGDQSVKIEGTNVIWHDVSLGTSGTYEFMFYDDMADYRVADVSKSARVGLHYGAGPYNAPRLGGIAVESSVDERNYVVHRRWSFEVGAVERSEGWHHGVIEWYDATDARGAGMTAYIDGTLAYEFNDGYELEGLCEVLGSPYGGDTSMWVDAVPEPATLGLVALAGVAALRRRRR